MLLSCLGSIERHGKARYVVRVDPHALLLASS
jgi:hypothetical protein